MARPEIGIIGDDPADLKHLVILMPGQDRSVSRRYLSKRSGSFYGPAPTTFKDISQFGVTLSLAGPTTLRGIVTGHSYAIWSEGKARHWTGHHLENLEIGKGMATAIARVLA